VSPPPNSHIRSRSHYLAHALADAHYFTHTGLAEHTIAYTLLQMHTTSSAALTEEGERDLLLCVDLFGW
jgi:hypothetical protein